MKKRYCLLFLLLMMISSSLLFPLEISAQTAAAYHTGLSMASDLTAQMNRLRSQDGKFSLYINGERKIAIELLSYVRNGHLMLPLRDIAVLFGLEVQWNDASKTIRLSSKNLTASARAGSYLYSIGNMGPVRLNMYTEIKNGKAYVPADFFSEILHASLSIRGSELHIQFQYENINSIMKIQSIASTYATMLKKKGYIDVSFHLMYVGSEVGSVLFKGTLANAEDSRTELHPLVFSIRTGTLVPLIQLLSPKERTDTLHRISEKYALQSFDFKVEGNYYIVKKDTKTYIVAVQKNSLQNYIDKYIPLTEFSEALQVKID